MRRLSATQRDGKWMRLRAVLLAAAMLALFGIVLVRAAKVQLLDRSRLSRLQRDQTRRELEWVPRRGMIVDRQFCRKMSTTSATRPTATKSVLNTSRIDSRTNGVVS